MKKNLLFISGLMLVTTTLFAQPTFTSSYYPHPDSTAYAQFINTSGLSLGSTGASLTWNYTSLTDSGSLVTETYVNPTPTKWDNLFPGSNVAQGSNSTGYLYSQASSNNYVILGFAGTTPGDSLFYTIDEVVFEYPFTYQTVHNTTFAAHSSTTAGGYTETDTRTGTDTFNADGYGTLELPNGHTFTNVLRVSLVQNYLDAFAINGTPYDTIFETVHTIDYFYTGNSTQPLLSISNVSQTQSGFTQSGTSAYYYPNGTAGINIINPVLTNLIVFPNPSYSQSSLNLSLNEGSSVNIYVTNLLGQKVKTITTAQVDAGEHNYIIETSDMAKGIYLVNVEVNGSIAGVRKLEIE